MKSIAACTLRAHRRSDPTFAAAYTRALAQMRNVPIASRESFVQALRQDEVYAIALKATRSLPWEMRDDVTSDLVVALITGTASPDTAGAKARELASAYRSMFQRYDTASLDAEIGDDGFSLHGLIADPRSLSEGQALMVW